MSNRPNSSRNRAMARAAQAAPAAEPPAKPIWQQPLVWVIALVLIVAVVTGVLASNNTDTPTARQETGFAETIGSPLPLHSEPDAAIGMEAPSIVSSTFDGVRVQLGNDLTAQSCTFVDNVTCP